MRIAVVALALFGLSHTAAAAPSWMQPDKSGPFMFNLQIGPAIGARNATNMGAIVLDFGFALDSGKHAYLLFPLQFQFANVGVSVFGVSNDYTVGYVMVPVGFQYDIAVPAVPGLYFSPRIVGGYVAVTASCANCATSNAGFIAPELAIKLVIAKRWNVGLYPFSLPIFISSKNNTTSTSIDYRILFFGGLNF
ncbi:MAG: hypothetical protein JWM53_4538 [bacterium]|nr:hypothetical protein [bacterium]